MKYLLILVLFASCSKSYTCECKTPTGGHLGSTSQVTGSKKEAAAECKATEYYYSGLVTCALQ